MAERRTNTKTRSFGVGRREDHDASAFYGRSLVDVIEAEDRAVATTEVADEVFAHSAEHMAELPDNSVALMVTPPPYHVGEDYDSTRASRSTSISSTWSSARPTASCSPGGRFRPSGEGRERHLG
jgi:hypothetical protein